MTPQLLFTGRGGNGSWEVRGNQLGKACGGFVIPKASLQECLESDLIVAVKRVPPDLLNAIRKSGRKWAYDVVDFYPQPLCKSWDRNASIRWVQSQVKAANPNGVIWPTARMMDDCSDGRPGIVIPHHHRPKISINPIRTEVKAVGYEGSPRYLGGWHSLLERECKRRGWRFELNPPHLADLDIVVAVRGDQWDCYATRHWKSNVKLANAHASGTPFVGNPEWGYMETGSGGEYWVDDGNHLAEAFDHLTPQSAREQVSDRFRQKAYPVERAARELWSFMESL